MIIDWYSDDPYTPPTIYIRTRGNDGILHERYIDVEDEDYVYPFCWVNAKAPAYVKKRISNLNGNILREVTAIGLQGEELRKVIVPHPNILWEIKDKCPGWTFEADLNYLDQIAITLYPDKIPEFKPRRWYYDLEWDTGLINKKNIGLTTVMAVVDSDYEHPVVFAWHDDEVTKTEWIDRYGGYELRTYKNVHRMHDGFLTFLEERDPDMLIAHAGGWADLPHLHRELGSERSRMSPLNTFLSPAKDGSGYGTTRQPIKGRLVFDTAAPFTDGSGFEGVWQKSGKGQAQSRKLDWFAKELGFGGKLTNDIEGMTVHNGWYHHYDDFVDYCLVDTTLLRDCDEKLHCIDFHLALQQVAGVSFGSTHKVTRYFRGLIGRRTALKAPSSIKKERPELQAAWVMDPVPGRHEDVALVDFASLYPNIILSANLCWTTLLDVPNENCITTVIPPKRDDNGNYIPDTGGTYHWDQSKGGLFPSVVKELLALRRHYKGLMKQSTNADERLGYNMLQMAVKVAVNAMYGMTGSKRFGGQWSSYPIAQAITYLGRESISMLVDESERKGYRALAGHTDSCYIQVPFEEAENIATHLTDVAQNKLDLKYLDVELEAFFPYWFTANMKNRNFGVKSWPESEAGDMKVTGYSLKAANAPPLTKDILSSAFNMIATGANEEEVFDIIRPMVKEAYTGKRPIDDAASYGRIQKKLKDYDKVVPNTIKASRYANKYNNTQFNKGTSVKWVFIYEVPEGQDACNVIAYDEISQLDGYSVDWSTTVDKWVKRKIKSVYETLNWDLERLTALRIPKSYGW